MTWTVTPIVEGTSYSSTTTLLTSASHRVIVDTGLSIQERELRAALAAHRLAAEDIDLVINTHLHLDHCSNNVIFSRATILFSREEWAWTDRFYTAIFASRSPETVAVEFYPELPRHHVQPRTIRNVARLAKLFWRRERLGREHQFGWLGETPLPEGLTLLPTPGHTPHHASIRVSGPEPVIIAGDAVLNEDPSVKIRTMVPYSQAQFDHHREALVARGETIIPGHGPAFRPAAVAR